MQSLLEFFSVSFLGMPVWVWSVSGISILVLIFLVLLALSGSSERRITTTRSAGAKRHTPHSSKSGLDVASTKGVLQPSPDAVPVRVASRFDLVALPSQTGAITDGRREASADTHTAGYLTFGPYVRLGEGKYEVQITYASPATPDQPVATLDVFITEMNQVVAELSLLGTEGEAQLTKLSFEVGGTAQVFEFRVFWPGVHAFSLHNLELEGP